MKPLTDEARKVLSVLEVSSGEQGTPPRLGELEVLTELSAEELGAAFCELIRRGILDYRPGDGCRVVGLI